MTVPVKMIRARLVQEHYQKFVVADINAFPMCIAKTREGNASTNRYQAYKDDPLSGTSPFSQWSTPQAQPLNKAHEFVNFAEKRNDTGGKGFYLMEGGEKVAVRVAGSSNFAYHSAGVLLDNPEIRKDYDVAVIGSMYDEEIQQYRHNITLLLPKGVQLPSLLTEENFPDGALIVDSWAVGMGYPVERALVVSKDDFVYRDTLFPALVNYHSYLDDTLEDTETNELIPYTGNVRQLERLESYSDYNKLWQDAFKEIMNNEQFATTKGDTEQKKIHAIRSILDDYTHGGDTWWAAIKRFFTGHWNRHHITEVDTIVKDIDQGKYQDTEVLLQEIENLSPERPRSSEDDLQKRINFFKIKREEEPETRDDPRFRIRD